LMRFTVSC